MQKPLIIAHRGATKLAPENSISAFEAAIEKGADAIEFDVHFSKDNQLVIHHDYFLGRTEDGSGFVGDFTLEELQEFDIGSKFDHTFSKERMPTLKDILDIGRGKIRFEIELRNPSILFLQHVLGEIERTRVETDVELTSPHTPLLLHIKKHAPYIRTGVFFNPFPAWKSKELGQEHLIDWMKLLDAQVAHLPKVLLENDFLKRLHKEGMLVHGANLNKPDEIKEALSVGVDQLSTDDLDTALDIVATIKY